MSEDTEKERSMIPGLVTGGSCLVGIMAIVMALFAVSSDQDFRGAGLCLLAAAVSFGMLANALYRR